MRFKFSECINERLTGRNSLLFLPSLGIMGDQIGASLKPLSTIESAVVVGGVSGCIYGILAPLGQLFLLAGKAAGKLFLQSWQPLLISAPDFPDWLEKQQEKQQHDQLSYNRPRG